MSRHLTSLPTINPIEFAEKGKTIYQQLSHELKQKHQGKFLAIEIDSGKYFIGNTQEEVFKKAKTKFPQKIFYFHKIGFPAAVTVSSFHKPSYGSIF